MVCNMQIWGAYYMGENDSSAKSIPHSITKNVALYQRDPATYIYNFDKGAWESFKRMHGSIYRAAAKSFHRHHLGPQKNDD